MAKYNIGNHNKTCVVAVPEKLFVVNVLHCSYELTRLSRVHSPSHKYFDVETLGRDAPCSNSECRTQINSRVPALLEDVLIVFIYEPKAIGKLRILHTRFAGKPDSIEFPAKKKAGK